MRRTCGMILLCLIVLSVCGFNSNTFAKGVRTFNAGRYQAAIPLFQKTLKQHPLEAIVHYNLGMAYFKNEDYTAAKAYFESAMQLDPRFEPLSRFYAGLCYYQVGDMDKARQELQWVAQICDNTSLAEAAKEVIKAL